MRDRRINPPTERDRFWDKVALDRGCWEWRGATNPCGYGLLRRTNGGGLLETAHRVSWRLNRGPIPAGMCVLHHCDNRRCVNPTHLYIGTKQDNSDDMMRRGRNRQPSGERNGNSKLTAEDVVAIRSKRGRMSCHKLGKLYGVSGAAVCNIWSGRTWNRLPGDPTDD